MIHISTPTSLGGDRRAARPISLRRAARDGRSFYATRARIGAGHRHCRPRHWLLIERPTRARPDTVVDGFYVVKLAPNAVAPV